MVVGCVGRLLACFVKQCCCVLSVAVFFSLPFFFARCFCKIQTQNTPRKRYEHLSCRSVPIAFPRVTVITVVYVKSSCLAIVTRLFCFPLFVYFVYPSCIFCFSGKGEEQEEEGAEDAGIARQALRDSMKKARKADADYESDVSRKKRGGGRSSKT